MDFPVLLDLHLIFRLPVECPVVSGVSSGVTPIQWSVQWTDPLEFLNIYWKLKVPMELSTGTPIEL